MNSRVKEAIKHILNFERHTSFGTALKEAAVEGDFQVLVLNGSYRALFELETRHRITDREVIAAAKKADMVSVLENNEEETPYRQLKIDDVYTYWGTVSIGEEVFMLMLTDNENSYDASTMTEIAAVIEVAMQMWGFSLSGNKAEQLVQALRAGNIQGARTLAMEQKLPYGRSLDDIECVFALCTEDPDDLRRLEIDMSENAIVQRDGGWLYGISFGELALSETQHFCIGDIDDAFEAAEAFRLIAGSAALARKVFPKLKRYTGNELNFIKNAENYADAGKVLKPFEDLTENRKEQLLETLAVYLLDANASSAVTAEYMYIHQNTVQYRLKKAEELLGREVGDTLTMAVLTQAMAAYRIKGQ